MGIISKLFGLPVRCDRCGSSDAKDSFFGVRCRDPSCPSRESPPSQNETSSQLGELYYEPMEFHPYPSRSRPVTFDRTLNIDYINAFGQSRTFECDANSLKTRKQRVSVRILPTGGRVALAPTRIQNWGDVEKALRELEPDFSDPVEIHYENFRGENKTFVAARKHARFVKDRISVFVAPKKIRISLKIARIHNWESVKRQLK